MPLGPGWNEFYDAARQRVYYHHAPTNRTTWNREEALAADVSAQLATQRSTVRAESVFVSPSLAGNRHSTGVSNEVKARGYTVDSSAYAAQTSLGNQNRFSSDARGQDTLLFSDIHQFQQTEFAKKHFSTCKRGLFKRSIPVKEFLVWSKEIIDHPLLASVKGLEKYAPKISKDILCFAGDVKSSKPDQ
eukprot:TRINITY_DN65_c0_g1_i1.p1 TRINITY_DN65_c0_g1~~TRINITY_DN65_c0_g1_i1.p1  ORF type:complete len:189 (-),score=41.80 TRINITY_DN65_c0_g1_i1:161-727(-)